jgi:hypothetical protein
MTFIAARQVSTWARGRFCIETLGEFRQSTQAASPANDDPSNNPQHQVMDLRCRRTPTFADLIANGVLCIEATLFKVEQPILAQS